MNSVIIVGGGTAGWMTACTLVRQFPDTKITLIESPNIATVGVGESTLGGINDWLSFVGIDEKDFLAECDGTYKASIKFTDFYKKGEFFHYPFGRPDLNATRAGLNDWWFKKYFFHDTPYHNFAESYYPLAIMAEENKLDRNEKGVLPFNFDEHVAYHFDATKFGIWLRDNYALPKGVEHIKEDITDIVKDESGIVSVNGYSADIYFDCTGFKSMLMEEMEVPFNSYEHMLVNDSAWATKVPYDNKEEQIVPYTNCTAIDNGWVWDIPLWSRMGSGYVYSSKFVSDEDALAEFKQHLGRDDLEFKKIKFTPGIRDKVWVKNVVAIGLSAGFIEPLESNGLMTVHEFLMYFMRNAQRERITQWDKDNFNFMCQKFFNNFAEFVAFHYAITSRDDTEYWRYCLNKEWNISKWVMENRLEHYSFDEQSGYPCIAAGGHWGPTEASTVMYVNHIKQSELTKYYYEEWDARLHMMVVREASWRSIIKEQKSSYEFLKKEIYDGSLCQDE